MQQAITLLIPLLTVLVLTAWHAGAIQRVVNKQALRLPKWAQPLPPILLSSLASVVVSLVQGLPPVPEDVGTTGLITVGLYHVAKRWVPTAIVALIRKAALTSLVGLVMGCAALTPSTPADAPAAKRVIEVARVALTLTSEAMAVAIKALPEGTDLTQWEKGVETLESAAAIIDRADATLADACEQLPVIGTLATMAGCKDCTAVITTAQALACEGGAK